MPLRDYPKLSIVGHVEALRQLINLRPGDQSAFRTLEATKLNGRNRTGVRAVPTSATDTTNTDIEGDFVNDGSYTYLLINVSGTPKWNRVAANVSW
jgi:hypothetical protein